MYQCIPEIFFRSSWCYSPFAQCSTQFFVLPAGLKKWRRGKGRGRNLRLRWTVERSPTYLPSLQTLVEKLWKKSDWCSSRKRPVGEMLSFFMTEQDSFVKRGKSHLFSRCNVVVRLPRLLFGVMAPLLIMSAQLHITNMTSNGVNLVAKLTT